MIVIFAMFAIAWTALITWLSVVTVKEGNVAVVFRFQKFDRVLKPGLKFIVPIVESVEVYPTQTRQFELPDEPENIDRENKTPTEGKKLPYRITHKGAEQAIFYVRKDYDPKKRDEESDPFDNTLPFEELKRARFSDLPDSLQEAIKLDSLDAPLTSEVAVAFEWHLKGKKRDLYDFIRNVSPESGRSRVEEVRKRADDVVASVLQNFLAPTTAGHAVYMSRIFQDLVLKELEILVGEKPGKNGMTGKPWGIEIGAVYLKPINPGKTINKARSDAGAAVSEKQTAVRRSEAQAQAAVNMGDANAHVTRVEGEARADILKKIGEVMEGPGALAAAQLDVAREVLPKANVVVMPSDLGAIGGILALGNEIQNKQKNRENRES